jgi:hypothetical protein
MKNKHPRLGDMVIYYEGHAECAPPPKPGGPLYNSYEEQVNAGRLSRGTNGTRYHPAVVTQVWSDTCVNLTVFLSTHKPVCRSSVSRLPDVWNQPGIVIEQPGWIFRDDFDPTPAVAPTPKPADGAEGNAGDLNEARSLLGLPPVEAALKAA